MIFKKPISATKLPSQIVKNIVESPTIELYSNSIGGYYTAGIEKVNGKFFLINTRIPSEPRGRDPWLSTTGYRKWGPGGYYRSTYRNRETTVSAIQDRPPIDFYFAHQEEKLPGYLCGLHCHLPSNPNDYRRVDCFKIPVDYVDAMTLSLSDTAFPVLLGCDNKYIEFCTGIPIKVYKKCIHFAITYKEPALNDIVKEYLNSDEI